METKLFQALSEILRELPERERDIVKRRFGLGTEKETLQEIGNDFDLTRERVRQLQDKSLERVLPKVERHPFAQQLSAEAREHLGRTRIRRGQTLLRAFAEQHGLSPATQNIVQFFLISHKKLTHQPETNDLHSFWGDSASRAKLAQHILKKLLVLFLRNPKKLWQSEEMLSLVEKELKRHLGVRASADELRDFLRILKPVGQSPANEFGILSHPRVGPSSLADKVAFVLDQAQKPLHFSEIHSALSKLTGLEGEFISRRWQKRYSTQSIQNLLIMGKDFVWTGMGTYALTGWGFRPGSILERMRDIVKRERQISRDKLEELLGKERRFSKITFEAYLRNKTHFKLEGKTVKPAR